MFLALRELTFARGRFTLMGIVIALISVLVVLLSGLSSGLVNDGVSGLKSMPATAFAFNADTITDNAFSRSLVDEEQLAVWQEAPGVAAAHAHRRQPALLGLRGPPHQRADHHPAVRTGLPDGRAWRCDRQLRRCGDRRRLGSR